MASYLITGSSRGIGLAVAALLASKPSSEVSKVFASARSNTDSLREIIAEYAGRVEYVKLDVTSEESVKEAARHVEKSLDGRGLDVLINNAGIMSKGTSVDKMEDLEKVFSINVTGVQYVSTAFLPLLRKGSLKKVINISSTLGSITTAPTYRFHPVPAYMVSKAALNMLTVQWSLTLESEGFTVVALSPGWIKTDLGGSYADLTIEQGSTATLDIILRVTAEDTGKFFNVHVAGWEKAEGVNQYDGKCPPW
ncbi:short chain oxidoreductase [Neofusicoccum parvum]|uniref:Short chain oxidoreductase n=1 Tax=Neofusicoccum parvum TaxID=310453 RepID=A0ACB5SKK0_9PEZI|nr:short chain oxidoreductase [Neofusicoccum parvum]